MKNDVSSSFESRIPMGMNFDLISNNLTDGRYRYIGSGSGRRVYDLENGYVIKAAKNQKGYAQNQMESKIYLDEQSEMFAPVTDVSIDFQMLIMQKGERLQSYHDLLNYYRVDNFNQLLRLPSFQYIMQRYHLVDADLKRMSSWGLIYGRPVLIDYGYTREVMNRYYHR